MLAYTCLPEEFKVQRAADVPVGGPGASLQGRLSATQLEREEIFVPQAQWLTRYEDWLRLASASRSLAMYDAYRTALIGHLLPVANDGFRAIA